MGSGYWRMRLLASGLRRRQSPISQLHLKDLMDREVALKDEVAAVLDLPDGVKAQQVHL